VIAPTVAARFIAQIDRDEKVKTTQLIAPLRIGKDGA
jgi:hypothetical protein